MRASTRSPAVSGDGAVVYVANASDDSVSAVSADGSAKTITIPVGDNPGAPQMNATGVTAYVPNFGHSTISWKKSKSSGVTGYVVNALPGGKTCSTKKTTCTIKKLSGGTKHTFAVQTTSKYGARVPRNSSTVTVKT